MRCQVLNEVNAEHAKELCFREEASNLIDVRANLASSCAFTPVIVPAVIEELTGDKVLVMEYCEGSSLRDAAALAADGIDLEQLTRRVCEAWAAQMFSDGLFNADAHAGNILVRNHPTHGAVPILLDFGLCKRLSRKHHLAICKMLHALEEFDGDLLIESLVELGFQVSCHPSERLPTHALYPAGSARARTEQSGSTRAWLLSDGHRGDRADRDLPVPNCDRRGPAGSHLLGPH